MPRKEKEPKNKSPVKGRKLPISKRRNEEQRSIIEGLTGVPEEEFFQQQKLLGKYLSLLI